MALDINILTRWAGELESLAEATGLGGMFRTADDDDLPSCLRSAAAELASLRAENAALRERVAVLERVREAALRIAASKDALAAASKSRISGVHGQTMAATAAFNRAEDLYREARLALWEADREMHEALAAAKPAAQERKEAADG